MRFYLLLLYFSAFAGLVYPQCYIRSGLTQSQKNAILAKHNELRNKVASGREAGQPSAANMKEMIWDDSLEQVAQQYANTCPRGHNPNSGAGENIYTSMSSSSNGGDPTKGVQMWYDEVNLFSSSSVSNYQFDYKTGHYTQVVWAESDRLACGSSLFMRDGWYTTILICNYLPQGNFLNRRMYETGQPGASCQRKSSTFPALCAPASGSQGTTSPTTTPTDTPQPTTPTDTSQPTAPTDPTSGSASCFMRSGLTNQQKNKLLDKHNELRNRVASGRQFGQPSASDMLEVKWDNHLATLAQRWANKCPDEHNPERGEAGENIFWSFSSRDNRNFAYERGVQEWFNEVSAFDRNGISSYSFDQNTGHYTQVVWANTNSIGCGAAVYQQNGMYTNVLVCNYSPPGNYDAMPVYREGRAGSFCRQKSRKWTSLCQSLAQ